MEVETISNRRFRGPIVTCRRAASQDIVHSREFVMPIASGQTASDLRDNHSSELDRFPLRDLLQVDSKMDINHIRENSRTANICRFKHLRHFNFRKRNLINDARNRSSCRSFCNLRQNAVNSTRNDSSERLIELPTYRGKLEDRGQVETGGQLDDRGQLETRGQLDDMGQLEGKSEELEVLLPQEELQDINKEQQPISVVSPQSQSIPEPEPVTQVHKDLNTIPTLYNPDPSVQRLIWHQKPQNVLVLEMLDQLDLDCCSSGGCSSSSQNSSNNNSKIIENVCQDRKCRKPLERLLDLIVWLIEIKCLTIYLEEESLERLKSLSSQRFDCISSSVITCRREESIELERAIDLIVCVGGDGALLDLSCMFQRSIAPVMAFRLNTHEFLSPLKFSRCKEEIDRVLNSGTIDVALRSRLVCSIRRDSAARTDTDTLPKSEEHLVLNEVSIERGSRSNLCQLDLHIDQKIVTTVQADGLLIATPTGSTGYAASTGSSMIHLNIPSILVTPVCPHSLSFRPIVVPASVEIKVMLSANTRGTVWVSFDGRHRTEFCKGDELLISSSRFPLPSICQQNQINDWFDTLAECLQWNVRKVQKGLS